jgi:hypothetical protein
MPGRLSNHTPSATITDYCVRSTTCCLAGELDIYRANSEALAMMSGAEVGQPQPATYNGIPVEEWPRVVLSPSFAPSLEAIKVCVLTTLG